MPDFSSIFPDLSEMTADNLYDWRRDVRHSMRDHLEQQVLDAIDDELSSRGLPAEDPALEIQF